MKERGRLITDEDAPDADKDAFLVKQMELYNEYELISHSKLADCTMFIVDMVYRPMHLHKELELCVVLSGQLPCQHRPAEL